MATWVWRIGTGLECNRWLGRGTGIGAALALVLVAADRAFAEQGQPDPGDTAWLLVSSALVMLMLPGLALFYGGMVRTKNVLSSLMHSFVALAVIGLQWVVLGYSLSFAKGNAFLGGLDHLLLLGITPESLTGSVPTYAFVMFQGMFAIITPALISGALAERMKFSTYLVFILAWAVLVYDPVAHWVWGGGWLGRLGALDFAGGTVVHLSSGASALAMALLLGKRRGYPHEMFVPHNLTHTLLGAGLLWFGWFGFNAGSALAANGNAALAFTTTMVAAAAAATSWMLMEWIVLGKPSALGVASGIVAGLVAVTPAAGFVTPGWAIVIGLSAGFLCFYGVRLKYKIDCDDSLDVVGIHGIGGAWGALATGLVATVGAGSLITGNLGQIGVQALSVLASGGYAFVVTYVLATVLDKTMGLRVSDEQEIIGLDKELHGEVGYNL